MNTYLVAAYMIIWGLIGLYMFKMNSKLTDLKSKVEQGSISRVDAIKQYEKIEQAITASIGFEKLIDKAKSYLS